MTPRSSHGFQHHSSPAHEFDGGGEEGGGGGLGNLADELADAWDEEEEEGGDEHYGEEVSELVHEEVNETGMALEHDGSAAMDGVNDHRGLESAIRDSGVVLESSPAAGEKMTLSPTRAGGGKHRRKQSRYDGSDYGDDSDLEASDGISAGLEARMAAVESLARRGMEENGSPADQVVQRVTDQLRDLGSQAGVESGATRLTTAHTALTSHLTHQTRILTSLTSTLFSPLSLPPDPETIDVLLPLISSTLELLPQAPTAPLYALSSLTHSTRDLLQTFSYLSDSLHMSRQSTGVATRRLKSVREQVVEWRKETEMREEGVRWIEKGGWDRRLEGREAGRVCGDVVGGFEEICGMWRARLCESLEVTSV